MGAEREITIVGGGIAGLSLGIALRERDVPVRLFEASSYPRHRVCGEFVSGVREETLERLGVSDLIADAEVLSTTTWHDRDGPVFSAALPVPARGLSRFRLDARLAERFVDRGGELHEETRRRPGEGSAEGLVLASGRALDRGSDWLGLKCHYPGLELESDLEMHLGEGGYVGLSRVEDGRVNACGLFRVRSGIESGRGGTFEQYIRSCGLESLGDRLAASGADESSIVGVSSFSFGRAGEGEAGTLAIGDRNAIIPPFTGNGMSMAFESSESVLPTLVDYSSGVLSWPETVIESRAALLRRFRRRLGLSRAIHPLLGSPRGLSVLRSMVKSRWLPFPLLFRLVR